jgi:tetratricopeptide (TPR) repeat protein
LNLSSVCTALGKYAEALFPCQQALPIQEVLLGPEHPDLASCLNHLALIYRRLGRGAEAEATDQRFFALLRKVLPADHADLGPGPVSPDGITQAEPNLREALSTSPKSPEADGTHEVGLLNELGPGRGAEARPRPRKAPAGGERILGANHPAVGEILTWTAELYQRQGRQAEAETAGRRAVAVREKALGPYHPDVALSLCVLGEACRDQGKHDEAESLFRRSLAVLEAALGPDHPEVVRPLSAWGRLHVARGYPAEAEPLLRRALAIRERVLGPQHPETAESRQEYAGLLRATGRAAEAVEVEAAARPAPQGH